MDELKIFEDLFDETTKTYSVFNVLKDKQWHCRECEYTHTGITQIAGGSGIQGLQRGNRKRNGMEIHSDNHLCRNCDRTTRHDKWTGNFNLPLTPSTMPSSFAKKIIDILGSRDIVESTKRPANQLTIDHNLPMLRWDEKESRRKHLIITWMNKLYETIFNFLKNQTVVLAIIY